MSLLMQLVPLVSGSHAAERRFGEDVEFLSQHVTTIVLAGDAANGAAPQVAVVPAYQGRVMTSTAGGAQGVSYGWINYEHIAAGKITPHINVYGGEERFWLGPEGGQFALFFPPGARFELDDWQTPAVIDTEPFEVTNRSERTVSFRREAVLTNYSRTRFAMRIDRRVEILSPAEAAKSLGVDVAGVPFVGYRTVNRLTNTGQVAWEKASGLPSIWLLGMYKHGPGTTVVIPFRAENGVSSGSAINDNYFGKVSADYLQVHGNVAYFSGNGQRRGKIGLRPEHSLGICGSFDPDRGVLTVVKYRQPATTVTDYVNSMWELQDKPYAGDAINAYNDGPPAPGAKPLGPFYELETSSPALALKPSETGEHVQDTYHFEGSQTQLDPLARALFGVSTAQIVAALPDVGNQ